METPTKGEVGSEEFISRSSDRIIDQEEFVVRADARIIGANARVTMGRNL